MSKNARYDPLPPTPTFETTEAHDRATLLPPPHTSATTSIRIHQQSDRLPSPSVDVAEYAPLSPLIQRTPTSARGDLSDIKLLHKTYDGFSSDDLFRNIEERSESNRNRRRASRFFQYDDEKWSDPGDALGSKTIWIAILTGLGLMGLFVLMGASSGGMDMGSMAGHATISTHFPFSPAHYLEDCQLQATDVPASDSESEDDSPLSLNTSIPIHIPYFSLTPDEQAIENLQPYSKTDNQGLAICEKTVSYLIDDDFGVRFTFFLFK